MSLFMIRPHSSCSFYAKHILAPGAGFRPRRVNSSNDVTQAGLVGSSKSATARGGGTLVVVVVSYRCRWGPSQREGNKPLKLSPFHRRFSGGALAEPGGGQCTCGLRFRGSAAAPPRPAFAANPLRCAATQPSSLSARLLKYVPHFD